MKMPPDNEVKIKKYEIFQNKNFREANFFFGKGKIKKFLFNSMIGYN